MVNQKDVPMPTFGKTALELLDSKGGEPQSLWNKYGMQTVGGVLCMGFHTVTNWTYKRPLIAGIHRYPIYFVAGVVLAQLGLNYRSDYLAERDAVLRHYIQLHPEDFPPPERKKYADVLMEWVPIR